MCSNSMSVILFARMNLFFFLFYIAAAHKMVSLYPELEN